MIDKNSLPFDVIENLYNIIIGIGKSKNRYFDDSSSDTLSIVKWIDKHDIYIERVSTSNIYKSVTRLVNHDKSISEWSITTHDKDRSKRSNSKDIDIVYKLDDSDKELLRGSWYFITDIKDLNIKCSGDNVGTNAVCHICILLNRSDEFVNSGNDVLDIVFVLEDGDHLFSYGNNRYVKRDSLSDVDFKSIMLQGNILYVNCSPVVVSIKGKKLLDSLRSLFV